MFRTRFTTGRQALADFYCQPRSERCEVNHARAPTCWPQLSGATGVFIFVSVARLLSPSHFPMVMQAGDSSVESDESSLEATDDLVLIARAGQGDERAFSQLVERHHPAVIGTISRMLGNDTEAHDLAQQVFIRVWRSAPRFRPEAKFTTWLFTITRHLVFNEIRRLSRAKLQPLDPSEEEGPPCEWADPAARTPLADLQAHETRRAIDAAIAALPEQQRLAVVLRRYEDLSYEEIAKILETTVSSVKSLLFRARTTLREQLKPLLDH